MRYITTYLLEGKIKTLTIQSVGQDAEELECSYTASKNVKSYNHFGKHTSTM